MSSTHMMNQAMGYLSEGRCSEHLLRTALEKDFKNELNLQERIEETLYRLHQLDLINDARIARFVAQRFSHKGDYFIKQHLEELGIKKAHIQSALTFIGSEYQRALLQAQNKCLNSKHLPLPELQTQIMRLLSSRTFLYHTVRQVMDFLFNPDDLANAFVPMTSSRQEPLYA